MIHCSKIFPVLNFSYTKCIIARPFTLPSILMVDGTQIGRPILRFTVPISSE